MKPHKSLARHIIIPILLSRKLSERDYRNCPGHPAGKWRIQVSTPGPAPAYFLFSMCEIQCYPVSESSVRCGSCHPFLWPCSLPLIVQIASPFQDPLPYFPAPELPQWPPVHKADYFWPCQSRICSAKEGLLSTAQTPIPSASAHSPLYHLSPAWSGKGTLWTFRTEDLNHSPLADPRRWYFQLPCEEYRHVGSQCHQKQAGGPWRVCSGARLPGSQARTSL